MRFRFPLTLHANMALRRSPTIAVIQQIKIECEQQQQNSLPSAQDGRIVSIMEKALAFKSTNLLGNKS